MRFPDIVRWSDLKSPAIWYGVGVSLVVPSVGDTPSRITHGFGGKEVMYQPVPGMILTAVTLSDPSSKLTCVLPHGQFYISGKDGLTAVWLDLVTYELVLARSYVTTSDGEAAAIEKFTTEFDGERLAAQARTYPSVSLSAVAPADFFVRNGRPTWPDLNGYDVRQGILRVDLGYYPSVWGKFWIDLATLRLTRTEFGPRHPSGPRAANWGTKHPCPHP